MLSCASCLSYLLSQVANYIPWIEAKTGDEIKDLCYLKVI